MPKLTEARVRDLQPAEREYTEWDSELRGFGLRVWPTGKKAWLIKYRNTEGRQRKPNIGTWPILSAEAARRAARIQLGDIAKGGDPAADEHARRTSPTMSDLAQDYLEHAAATKRASSVRGDRAIFEKVILPPLGSTKVAALTRRQIEELHRSMKDRPYYANRMLALLSHALNVAIGWGWRTDNPGKGIRRYSEEKRTKYLNAEQMARLLATLLAHENRRAANAILLLLLTGARRSEALGATWDMFDLNQGIWTKPSAHTKQNKEHRVPLNDTVLTLLRAMRAEASADQIFLFPGDAPGKPYQEPKKFWAAVCKQADLEGFRIHDLRHTFVSWLVTSGVPLFTAGQLAGHTQLATTQRYAHLADDPLRAATATFGALIQGVAATNTKL